MAITTISNAIQAYNAAAKSITSGAADSADDSDSSPGISNFAGILKQGAQAAIAAGKQSEKLSQQAIAGKADVREVVAAVNNAELTLDTVVAVRDKVIGAYNDILKMPI